MADLHLSREAAVKVAEGLLRVSGASADANEPLLASTFVRSEETQLVRDARSGLVVGSRQVASRTLARLA